MQQKTTNQPIDYARAIAKIVAEVSARNCLRENQDGMERNPHPLSSTMDFLIQVGATVDLAKLEMYPAVK